MTPQDPRDAPPAELMTFEVALERLRAIVEELERGDLTLDESIARYEEGMKLSRRLTEQLDEAEQRIERLVGGGRDGDPPTTRPMQLDREAEQAARGTFDPDAGESIPRAPRRAAPESRSPESRERAPSGRRPLERDAEPPEGELPF